MSKSNHKKHYYLASTRIHFTKEVDGVTDYGTMDINCILMRNRKTIAVDGLAKIQQMAQVQFHNRVKIEDANVVDVFIMGISYLGLMSDEEFNTAPVATPAATEQGNNQKTDLLAGVGKKE